MSVAGQRRNREAAAMNTCDWHLPVYGLFLKSNQGSGFSAEYPDRTFQTFRA